MGKKTDNKVEAPVVDHPADVHDPDNGLGLADKVELAAGKTPDTLEK